MKAEQVVELVRQEMHGQLGPVLKLLNNDLEDVFSEFNSRLNELLTRIEKLEGAEQVPADRPSVEL